jgi:FkbM family methyltransferase
MRLPRPLVHALAGVSLTPDVDLPFERLGTEYGAHAVLPDRLGPDSVVYSFGVGEDISFDLALVQRWGMTVHAFDPTPRSIAWVKTQSPPALFVMNGVGLAATDGEAVFEAPANPAHISHRMTTSAQAGAVTMPVRRLSTLMAERGHTRLDVLKMDIEGAEYDVIDDLVRTGARPAQILVEFHPNQGVRQAWLTRRAMAALRSVGYRVFAVSASRREVSLVNTAA